MTPAPAPDHSRIGGWRVTIERLVRGRTEQVIFGTRGTYPSIAYAQAKKKSGYLRALKLEPLNAEQYEQEFPAGQCGRSGRYVSLRNTAT